MASHCVGAEAALDPAPEHSELVDRAMRCISRNLLRYQQIEHGLKSVFPGTGKPEAQDSAESERDSVRELPVSETLGNLHRRWTELVLRCPEGASEFIGERDAVASEARTERERRVIDDRNRLVHHLDCLRLAEADRCRSLIAELDDAFARAEEWHRCVHWLSIGAKLARSNATGAALGARAPRVVELDKEATRVQAPCDLSMRTQQDAIAALRRICTVEWMRLSNVGQLLYAEVPGIQPHIRKAGGLACWIGAVAALEVRAVSMGGTAKRAEVRLRAGASSKGL